MIYWRSLCLMCALMVCLSVSGCHYREEYLAYLDKRTQGFELPAKPAPGKSMIYFSHSAGLPKVDVFIAGASEEQYNDQESGFHTLKKILTLGFGAPKIDDSRKHVVHLSHNSYAYVELDPGFYQLSFSVDDPQKIFMPIHPMRYVKIDENKTYFYRYQAFVNRDKYMVLWHTVQMDEMRDLPEIKFQIMNGKNLSQGQVNFD